MACPFVPGSTTDGSHPHFNSETGQAYRAIAAYYDAENAHSSMLARDVPFLLSQMPVRPQRVLELATGTARAAIPLAQAGHRLVGLDYAEDMLQVARQKRDAVGLTERQLRIVAGDLRSLNLREKFDWVVLLFNTFLGFTRLEEQDAVLAGVRRACGPAVISGWTSFSPILNCCRCIVRTILIRTRFLFQAWIGRSSRPPAWCASPTEQLQHVTFHYKWFEKFGRVRQRKVQFELTFMLPRELRLLLERHGLLIERMLAITTEALSILIHRA